jgi:hypothetical protein
VTSILVRRTGAFGDVIDVTPVVRRLRHENPDAEIDVLQLPDVTLIALDTVCHELTALAIKECLDKAQFGGITSIPMTPSRLHASASTACLASLSRSHR